jgi:GT2 family glycosyltransferase
VSERRLEALAVAPSRALEAHELPRVRVIVLNLNGKMHLDPCFTSLAALDYPKEKLEVVLIDNGSADGSADEVRRTHPWVRLVENARNVGFSAGCNQGVALADAPPVVAFLNNDMRVEARWLEELVTPIVRGDCRATTGKMLSWDGMRMDSAGGGMNFAGIGIQYGYKEDPGPAFDFPRRTLFACGGSMAVDTRTLVDVGGFDEEFFAYYEDVDLGWRMNVQGYECRYVPTAVCYHRHSSTSHRIPRELIRVLQTRNPLLACVKNYDDAKPRARPGAAPRARDAQDQAHRGDRGREGLPDRGRPEQLPGRAALPARPSETQARRPDRDQAGGRGGHPRGRRPPLELGHWMDRRAEVQSKRSRPDAEIFELFLKPFWCTEPNDSFCELQTQLVRFAGLDRLLPPDSIAAPSW